MGFHSEFCEMTKKNDVEINDFGIIDSSEKAYEVVLKILAANSIY